MHISSASLAVAALSPLAGTVKRGCDGQWDTLAPIPIIPRQENTAVAINETTFAVLGGLQAAGTDWVNTNLVTYYDIPTNTWVQGPAMPVGLNHPNAVARDGKIYLLGGLAETDDGPWTATSETWVLDPATGQWDSLAPYPDGSERGASVLGLYGDRIFVAGGLSSLDFRPQGLSIAVDTVSAYNIATDEWTSYPDVALPVPKDHATGGVIGSTLWVVGGRHLLGGDIVTNDVFALDLEDIEAGWEDLTDSAPMPTPRGGLIGGIVGNLLYTFGGEGIEPVDGVFNDTQVFDTEGRSWKVLAPMPLPRHGTVGVAVNGAIYIPGGGLALGAKPTNTTEVFHP